MQYLKTVTDKRLKIILSVCKIKHVVNTAKDMF